MKENKSITSKGESKTFKKKNVVINNHFVRLKTVGEVNTMASLTVPDQTLSLRQLLDRYTRGQGISIKRDATYSDEDFTELEKMDKFERADLKAQNKEYIDELRQEIQAASEKMKPKTEEQPNQKQQPTNPEKKAGSTENDPSQSGK